jgi:competence ComEA-like helix-hairpin-helix protein
VAELDEGWKEGTAESESQGQGQDTADQDAAEPEQPKLGFLARRAEARRARRAEKAAEDPEEKVAEARTERNEPARPKSKPRRRGAPLDVNKATFEELRDLGMSVTEATRVIAYRERRDGFDSVDDLDTVPGVSTKLMSKIRDQLTA